MDFILRVFRLISPSQRMLVVSVTGIRLLLSIFDVAGLAFIGLSVSILAGSKIDNNSLSGQVLQVLSIDTEEASFFLVAVIGVLLFAFKAIISVLLNLWIGLALAKTEVERTSSLFARTLLAKLDDLESYTARQVAHALNGSATVTYSKSLNAFSLLLADAFLAALLLSYMILADAFTTGFLVVYFAGVAALLQLLIGRRIRELSALSDEANVGTNSLVIDVYDNIRQIRGQKARASLKEDFRALRTQLASSRAKGAALGLMPRYTLEIALALGVLLLVSLQLSGGELVDPAVTAILLAGAFRLSTTFAALQSGWNQLNEIRAQSRWTLNLEGRLLDDGEPSLKVEGQPGAPQVEVRKLKYSFPGSEEVLFSALNLDITAGGLILVRGPSGRGKSTLADLMLGMRTPVAGQILLDGLSIEDFVSRNPSSVAYVPQHTPVIEGSIARNVSFQQRMTERENQRAYNALHEAELGSFVASLQDGLSTRIGAGAHGMSGGQIQRLGLARALYLQPRLLILDEVTSSLDEATSEEITRLINSLKKTMTIMVISHKPEKSLEFDSEFVL